MFTWSLQDNDGLLYYYSALPLFSLPGNEWKIVSLWTRLETREKHHDMHALFLSLDQRCW